MRHLRRVGATALLALTLATTPSVAHAEFASSPDEVGDAPAALDISRIAVANGAHAVTVRLLFTDLRRSRIDRLSVLVDVGPPIGEGYFVQFRRGHDGSGFSGRLEWAPLYSESGQDVRACPGLRLTWGEDRADVRLPRACMTEPQDNRVRVAAFVDNRAQTQGDSAPRAPRLFGPWVRRS